MEKKAILVVGLPGSGKTTLAKKLAKKYNYFLIDDPRNFDTDVKPFFGKNLIIVDPYFCKKSILDKAISKLEDNGYKIVKIIYFENDPIKAKINASKRINKSVNGLIELLSKTYNPIDPIKIKNDYPLP